MPHAPTNPHVHTTTTTTTKSTTPPKHTTKSWQHCTPYNLFYNKWLEGNKMTKNDIKISSIARRSGMQTYGAHLYLAISLKGLAIPYLKGWYFVKCRERKNSLHHCMTSRNKPHELKLHVLAPTNIRRCLKTCRSSTNLDSAVQFPK